MNRQAKRVIGTPLMYNTYNYGSHKTCMTYLTYYDVQNFPQGFPKKTLKLFMCKSSSSFNMGLNGSLYDYIIHVALIATLCVLLTTCFQPHLTYSILFTKPSFIVFSI